MEATLDAVERTDRGKNEARRLRASGKIPAVVYGGKDGGKAIAVDPKGLAKILRTEQGANTLIALNLAGGGDARVLVREYQLDPITHELLHADFYRVAMDKLIRVPVSVVAQGEPKGVKQQGGVLDIVHRQIEIECLPADIPNHIEVDVRELMVGQSIRVKDIATNPKWKAVTDPEMMLLHVIIPKVEETPAPAEAAAAGAAAAPAEPEVIKKGKKEEEGAEAAPAAGAPKKEKK
ncbi:MAG TPA: 50S ribosomal protein L25 [Vicinamibacterales bacterium]|nr:50S ribosomal protein L25 [Vicinamibacterales bacterium]